MMRACGSFEEMPEPPSDVRSLSGYNYSHQPDTTQVPTLIEVMQYRRCRTRSSHARRRGILQGGTAARQPLIRESASLLHQRLFVLELWDVTARAAINPIERTVDELVELVEAWEATAELDSTPELIECIRAPKSTGTSSPSGDRPRERE